MNETVSPSIRQPARQADSQTDKKIIKKTDKMLTKTNSNNLLKSFKKLIRNKFLLFDVYLVLFEANLKLSIYKIEIDTLAGSNNRRQQQQQPAGKHVN